MLRNLDNNTILKVYHLHKPCQIKPKHTGNQVVGETFFVVALKGCWPGCPVSY